MPLTPTETETQTQEIVCDFELKERRKPPAFIIIDCELLFLK